MQDSCALFDVTKSLLRAELCVLPADAEMKYPRGVRWTEYQHTLPGESTVDSWFRRPQQAICIVCGPVSGNLEMIDFDCQGVAFEPWRERVEAESPRLLDRLYIETSPSGGRHAVYRCDQEICGSIKLAQRMDAVDPEELIREGDGPPMVMRYGKKCQARQDGDGNWQVLLTLIETRGEGGLFLCAPTPGYEALQGDLSELPVLTGEERDILLQAAWDMNEYVPPMVNGPANNPHMSESLSHSAHGGADISHNGACASEISNRPGDDFNRRGDVRNVLGQCGWSCVKGGENEYWRRPGKTSGWSATLRDGVFYVFSSSAAPFEPNRGYSPFSVYALLMCGGDFSQAAQTLRHQGFGGDSGCGAMGGVDLTALSCSTRQSSDEAENEPSIPDPGPIPEKLFTVPGFVSQVMDFTLSNAPYPNPGLAFCGALALQSFLCGRKVCDSGDLRPNIYLLALASSGTGKDFPRKVNARVLFEIGQVDALGDKFASGEGIQDALARTSAMLFQNDEMDGMLRQINLDRESRRESIPNILMTLYTSANDVYPLRVKAGQTETAHIDQPHLTLFGTATPQYFYESLNHRMLTNGFFSRLMVVDVGKRGEGQTPGTVRNLPKGVIDAARWWAEFMPGTRRGGNLSAMHPEPRVVACTPEAAEAIAALQQQADREYDDAHVRNDETARVAWSRVYENAKKLALLYACSSDHENPEIDLAAIEWAQEFAMHQTRRQLFLAAEYVAENPFHAECLKAIRKLREAPDLTMAHQVLLKRMKMKAKDFRELIETLVNRGDISVESVQTPGRTGVAYRLLTQRNEEKEG